MIITVEEFRIVLIIILNNENVTYCWVQQNWILQRFISSRNDYDFSNIHAKKFYKKETVW